MNTLENYRPKRIEFDVATDGTSMPETFGNFENSEEALKFINSNVSAFNQAITVPRHLDSFEKTEMRKHYNSILEDVLPVNEKRLSIARNELIEAKEKEKEANETVNATITEIKFLSNEVKRGVKDMKLDDLFTVRVPFKGRYYFYTFIDSEIRLCAIRDIPEHEKTDIFNAMSMNEKFIDDNFGTKENAENSKQNRSKK